VFRKDNIARLLALALLLAQFGATAHAYSHLKGEPYGVPGTPQGCGLCLSFMPLTTAVGSTPCVIAINFDKADCPAPTVTAPPAGRAFRPAFRPRAPPGLL